MLSHRMLLRRSGDIARATAPQESNRAALSRRAEPARAVFAAAPGLTECVCVCVCVCVCARARAPQRLAIEDWVRRKGTSPISREPVRGGGALEARGLQKATEARVWEACWLARAAMQTLVWEM